MPVDPDLFRTVMGGLPTGVTVVTARDRGDPVGMTVNCFLSISLEPPLVLASLGHGTPTERATRESGWFAVNILDAHSEELSERFAEAEGNPFEGLDHDLGREALPILPGGTGVLLCRVQDVTDVVDHALVIGVVEEARARDGDPLLWFRRRYRRLA
jgi:flavin reductase (DIM6/NTAB) family NADH-FMN oxidoreductase RutF